MSASGGHGPHPGAQCPACGSSDGRQIWLPVKGRRYPSSLATCQGCGEVYDASKSGRRPGSTVRSPGWPWMPISATVPGATGCSATSPQAPLTRRSAGARVRRDGARPTWLSIRTPRRTACPSTPLARTWDAGSTGPPGACAHAPAPVHAVRAVRGRQRRSRCRGPGGRMSESAVRQYEIRYDDRGYYAGRRTLSGGYAPTQQWGTYYVPGPDGERHGWLDFPQVGSYDAPRRAVHVGYIELDGQHQCH